MYQLDECHLNVSGGSSESDPELLTAQRCATHNSDAEEKQLRMMEKFTQCVEV